MLKKHKRKHKWKLISSAYSGVKGVLNHEYIQISKCKICKIIKVERDYTEGYWRRQKNSIRYFLKEAWNRRIERIMG